MATRCNGEMVNPPPWSKASRLIFEQHLPICRSMLRPEIEKELKATAYAGDRFSSDSIVWTTLRSGVPEDLFLRDPGRWTRDALLCCAERDHWYLFEKSWDSEDV